MQRGALQSDARGGGEAQVAFGAHEQIQHAQQPCLRHALRLRAIACLVLLGHIQNGGGVPAHGLDGEQRAAVCAQLAQKCLRLAPGAHELVHLLHHTALVPGGKEVEKAEKEFPIAGAQQITRERGGDFPVLRARHAHVQDAESVAHGAFGSARHHAQGLLLGLHAQIVQRLAHAADHQRGGNAAKIIALYAGENGGRQLLGLGGGQNEHHMRGRFLQRLKQRVKGRGGEHVHLVDDIHLVTAQLSGVAHLLQQLADVIDAVVAGCVQFQHIHGGFTYDGPAGLALTAGVSVIGIEAVNGTAHELCHGGFARTPAAAKQIGVRNAPVLDLPPEGFDRRRLTQHLFKGLRPPFAVQCLICHTTPS